MGQKRKAIKLSKNASIARDMSMGSEYSIILPADEGRQYSLYCINIRSKWLHVMPELTIIKFDSSNNIFAIESQNR